jgi:hypothetical protein
MLDTLHHIHEGWLKSFAKDLPISEKAFEIIQFYIRNNAIIENVDAYLNGLGDFINDMTSIIGGWADQSPADTVPPVFTDEERDALHAFLETVRSNQIRKTLLRAASLLEERLEMPLEGILSPDAAQAESRSRIIDRELGSLLIDFNSLARSSPLLADYFCLLLFYFSLYKLFQSKTLASLLNDFIPKRKNRRGQQVRNRSEQIRRLIESDEEYRESYFELIKTLYPLCVKQITTVKNTFGLSDLIFRNKDNTINKRAYLKILTTFVHNTINSGLGVVVGLHFRTAASALQKGARAILDQMGLAT